MTSYIRGWLPSMPSMPSMPGMPSFDWFFDLATYLGFYAKSGKLLLLGLDNAGKTTLLHMLRDDRVAAHAPTQRTTKETLTLGAVAFECYDLGGHAEAREIWRDYYVDVSAIVYMVDAYDIARLPESKRELDSLLTEPALTHVPIVVLGNKIDLPSALSETELRNALGLQITTGKNLAQMPEGHRPVELFMCSVINRAGFAEGFRWAARFI